MIAMTCDDCGHSGRYRTRALADHHFPRHSCELNQRRAARAERVAARKADTGERRDCEHPQARHEHGTRLAYILDRCRCRACRDAQALYELDRHRQHAYGRWNGLVDAEPAREHLRQLSAQGMGWKRAARAADVATGTVYAILWGKLPNSPGHPEHRPPRRRIRPDIAERLLAVQLDLAGGALIEQAGTVRRLQALVACGWSGSKLSQRLGLLPSNGWPIINGHRDRVTVATATAVRDLYEELWDTPPPADNHRDRIARSRAQRHAAANGWMPPMAWDDDTIDDPHAQPGTTVDSSESSQLEDIEWLLDQGCTPHEIAHRLGRKLPTLQTLCRRHDRGDLGERLNIRLAA